MSDSLQLPNRTTTPPGGWRYRVPETGQEFPPKGTFWVAPDQLMNALRKHYQANGYVEPPDLLWRVEQYICGQIPGHCVEASGLPAHQPAYGAPSTFHTVMQGTRTLVSWAVGGFQRVPVEHAEARASVCATCPENVIPKGCNGCNLNSMRELVGRIVGTRRHAYSDALKDRACRICQCGLEAKVQLPFDVMWPHMPEAQRVALPSYCWLLKEAETT